MASKNKRRGPKPQPTASPAAGAPPSPRPSATRGRRPPARGGPARGVATQWWIVIGVVLVAAIAGLIVQSSRSKAGNAKVVTPRHQLGPRGSEIEGAATAPVLVEEYADFQCPVCGRFHAATGSTVQRLVDQGRIRFAYHYFPFLGDESFTAAAAAACAGDQGRFFAYADFLYDHQAPENSGALTTARLLDIGEQVGLTGTKLRAFQQCVRAKRYDGFVRQKTDQGSKRGIVGTPTVFVNGHELPLAAAMDPTAFTQAVDRAAAQQ